MEPVTPGLLKGSFRSFCNCKINYFIQLIKKGITYCLENHEKKKKNIYILAVSSTVKSGQTII